MQAITAGVLSGVSDVVSQKLSGIQKIQLRRVLLKMVKSLNLSLINNPIFKPNLASLEFFRLLQQIFAGGFLGPVGHFFHTTLDKIFQGKKDTKTVAKKVNVQ